jgi:hypothetical protein
VQGVEVGDAVDAKHDGLAIDDELLVPVLQRAIHDPRIASGLVVAVPGEQVDAIAVADYDQALASYFDSDILQRRAISVAIGA